MRARLALLAVAAGAVMAAQPALAIPAFARRYSVECHFCHEAYPKLNGQGQRFKERGFRLEKEPAFDGRSWIESVPLTGRGEVNRFFGQDVDASTFGYVKAISAGNLGPRLSYWLDDAVLIHEKSFEGDDNFTHVKPDNAWLRFDLRPAGKLYAKAGRLELDLPFTQTRTPHLFSYEIYFANTGSESDTIGSFQDGFELGGTLPGDAHWSAAVVKGHNSQEAEVLSDKPGSFDFNLYLRLAKRLDKKYRIGAFAYLGRNHLAKVVQGDPLAPAPPRPVTLVWQDGLLRLGADASAWIDKLNLYGVWMYGRNDNPIADVLHQSGTGQVSSFSGGFVQADWHPTEELVLTLRGSLVSQPPPGTADAKRTYTSLFPGVQFLIFEHGKLSFEYGFFDNGRSDFGAVQAELTF